MSLRRGSLAIELTATIAGLGILTVLSVSSARDRTALKRMDERAARLELAQNLLAELRDDRHPILPPGWSVREEPAGSVIAITLDLGDGRRLTTLRAVRGTR